MHMWALVDTCKGWLGAGSQGPPSLWPSLVATAHSSQRLTRASLCVQEYARLEGQIQELRATMKELISHRVEDKHHK